MIVAFNYHNPLFHAIADITYIAFFYLLQLGKYVISPLDSMPFKYQDVQLFRKDMYLNLLLETDKVLLILMFSILMLTTQKNAVRND